jgi:hypothetical protein
MTDFAKHRGTDRSGSEMPYWSAALEGSIFATGLAILTIGSVWSPPSVADTPAFDRPGIAFSSTTLPAQSFAWEQGLPDFESDRADGVTQRAYAANARLRYGISDQWELQLAAPWYERIDTNGSGRAFTAAGAGDVSVAVKVALPSGNDALHTALLGAVSFATGQGQLSLGTTQYSLGTTVGWSVSDQQSLAFYVNVDVLDGQAKWTLSPSWSFSVSDTIGGYIEAGYQPASHGDPANAIAGGGLTWMAKPTVQLDVYWLSGLTQQSTNLAAGFGVSVVVP